MGYDRLLPIIRIWDLLNFLTETSSGEVKVGWAANCLALGRGSIDLDIDLFRRAEL